MHCGQTCVNAFVVDLAFLHDQEHRAGVFVSSWCAFEKNGGRVRNWLDQSKLTNESLPVGQWLRLDRLGVPITVRLDVRK